MAFDPKFIRNFSIVAHIDHGKSTLADQLLLQSGAITQREFREQLLDDMDLERERGITIKARAVAINYVLDGQNYELNLIDTPGHVDFHYEVSRSLAACEGAILLVDATQGVQAQTVANAYAAINANLAIVPALNKIDMQAARPDEIREEIEATLGIDRDRGPRRQRQDRASASPRSSGPSSTASRPRPATPNAPLRALIFDSKFDDYQGVVIYVRVVDGLLKVGQKIRLMAGGTEHEVISLGRFRPRETPCDDLGVGQVGYVTANIKRLSDVRIGDTITDARRPAAEALPGYQEPAQVVYCGLFPATHNQFEDLRTALQKLSLNDASFTFEPESSDALGLRLPLRVPGHAPHGDRPAAARAREQPLARPDRPQRHLRDPHQEGRDPPHLQPDPDPRPRRHRGVPRAGRPGQLHHPVGLHRRDHAALRGPPGDLPQDRVHDPDPGHPLATSCRWPR